MKSTFDYHFQENEEDIKKFWENGIFIFDTNVLLNLYRYKKETADKLFEVIENLGGRIWIPYHVGMEFHKNRLTTIADQSGKFSTVKSAIDKIRKTSRSSIEELKIRKRHSLINIEDFSEKIENLLNEFDKDLGVLEEVQQSVTEKDSILDKIHSLFDGRVGIAPDQKTIDSIYADGAIRYKYKRPPGYKDLEKGEKDEDVYFHAGVLYKGRFGDLVAWNQIIEHAKKEKFDTVIFITDDGKEDWWLQIESRGKKTIGPRLELVHEIRQEAGVKKFLMYQTEQFLSYANNYLNAKISPKEINEVREVILEQKSSNENNEFLTRSKFNKLQGALSEIDKIYSWRIEEDGNTVTHKKESSSELVSVRAVHYDNLTDFEKKLMQTIHSLDIDVNISGHNHGHVFLSFNSISDVIEAIKILQKYTPELRSPITVTIGTTSNVGDEMIFTGLWEHQYRIDSGNTIVFNSGPST
jgi:hypothetical protein